MNAGPYSSGKVQTFIEKEYVPLKSECSWKKRTDLMKRFDIVWTPTFLFQDSQGKLHRKLVGFMPSDDFLAQLKFGKGILFFEKEQHDEAYEWFKKAVEEHPNAGVAPEAIFFLGVVEYKKTHEVSALRRIYDTLSENYPQSEWLHRAKPYSEIPE
jgi:tetratricopeptide (TPR) repeat protein